MTSTLPGAAGTALAGLAAAAVALAPTASAATVAAPEATVGAAAEWLVSHLGDGYRVDGEFGPSYGQGADVALALLASGGQDDTLGQVLTWLEQNAADYTQGTSAVELGEKEGAAYVGATAKLAFTVEVTGGDARDVAGLDLVAQLQRLQQESGRFADDSAFGDFANLYGHSFALLALDAAGLTPDTEVVDALLATQCPDGSFPETYPADGGACEGQVDATGLVLQALAAVDAADSADAEEAVAWLRAQQAGDGSFPGEARVNSTGYAALGLLAAGESAQDAVTWLAEQQNADGGLPRGAADGDAASDLYATAQALPALAGTPFLAAARDVERVALPAPAPTPTDTATPTTTASPTATSTATATATATASPSATTTTTAPTTTTTAAPAAGAADSPTRTTASRAGATSGTLPRTGTDPGPAVAAGAGLLALGAVLVAATTRRRGRHG